MERMRWQSRTKRLKYRLKAMALGRSPNAYWTTRRLLRGWQEAEMRLVALLCRPDQHAVDVGASFGMYTWLLSRKAAHCHSFEPNPTLAGVLRRGYHGTGRVTVHEVALSHTAGRATMRTPRAAWGYSTIEPANHLDGKVDAGAGLDLVQVRLKPLDDYALENVGFVKIDAEGHEVAILEGARETLARERPCLLVEAEERHKPGSPAAVHAALRELDFTRMALVGQELVPTDEGPHHQRNQIYLPRELARGIFVG